MGARSRTGIPLEGVEFDEKVLACYFRSFETMYLDGNDDCIGTDLRSVV